MSSVICLLAASLLVQGPPAKKTQTPWQWSTAQVKAITNVVRAGKNLTPKRWPGKNRVAVALSFDLDNETPRLRDNIRSPGALAQGEYGSRAGLPRILALLKRHQIPATFFMPAMIAHLYPDSVKAVLKDGHEIGMHGWIHERNSKLTEAQERLLMKRAYEPSRRSLESRP